MRAIAVQAEAEGASARGLAVDARAADRPRPARARSRIEVAAAGVNFADLLMIAGNYQERPLPPFTPGLEVAGRVAPLGPASTRVKPGDRVLALLDHGGFAEQVVASEAMSSAFPPRMDFVTAAGFAIAYGTAHGALRWRADLKPGELLLVLGAAGGVGLTAVEVGKALGATVIASAGGPEKLAIAKAHGADHLIDYRDREHPRPRERDRRRRRRRRGLRSGRRRGLRSGAARRRLGRAAASSSASPRARCRRSRPISCW